MSLRTHVRHVRGWLAEAALYAGLAVPRRSPRQRFVIFGQGRSGSSLLVQLLNASPEIHCDGEILYSRVLFPAPYVEARSRRHPERVYGFKVKIDQLTTTQHIEPGAFLRHLHTHGWRIVYLNRLNILRQVLSAHVAKSRGFYHHTHDARRSSDQPVPVEIAKVLAGLRKHEGQLAHEAEVLRGFPHFPLVYEDHLLSPRQHQPTADAVFRFLGVVPVPVRASLIRTGTDRMEDLVANFDELAGALAGTSYASLLALL